MKKIIISLLICTSIISCCLSECGNDVSQNAENSITTNSVFESNKIVDIKTVEPPENGWTMESILNATYIYGEQLFYPLRVSDFGENFYIDDSEKSELSKYTYVSLMHEGKRVCEAVYLQGDVLSVKMEEVPLYGILFHDEYTDELDCISINGISFGSSKEEVEEYLGKPNKISDFMYTYNNSVNDKEMLIIMFDTENKVSKINFYFFNV